MKTPYTITELADIFEAAGIGSPYSIGKGWSEWYKASEAARSAKQPFDTIEPRAWHDLGLDADRLPAEWECPVHECIRDREAARAAVRKAARIEKFNADLDAMLVAGGELHRPIIQWLRGLSESDRSEIGFYKLPSTSDLTSALTPSKGRKYQPKAGAKCRLHAKQALYLGTLQNSYDDTSYYAIPFTGEACATCKANLRYLLDCAGTATGYAGQGYTMSITEWADGFVVISQRFSIAD